MRNLYLTYFLATGTLTGNVEFAYLSKDFIPNVCGARMQVNVNIKNTDEFVKTVLQYLRRLVDINSVERRFTYDAFFKCHVVVFYSEGIGSVLLLASSDDELSAIVNEPDIENKLKGMWGSIFPTQEEHG